MSEAGSESLEVVARVKGRAVLACADGPIFIGRNYDVLRSDDQGASFRRVASLPRTWYRWVAEPVRLACRLLRQEVRALRRLSDETLVASNREGLFVGRPGERELEPAHIDGGDVPVLPPMRLGLGPDDRLVWGEYGTARHRPVRLFASDDRGSHFEPIHSFEKGDVGHVHNILWDERGDHYWVLAGDWDHEPGFGCLSRDFRHFEWLVRGEQRFRAVEAFDLGDRLLYATDSEREPNRLVSLDKKDGRWEELRGFEGSCIYACRFGDWLAITTSVEPSEVNHSRDATLWISRDGEDWRCVLRAPKDVWNADYFQFGSLILPSGQSPDPSIVVSGQAVRGLDGQCLIAKPPKASS